MSEWIILGIYSQLPALVWKNSGPTVVHQMMGNKVLALPLDYKGPYNWHLQYKGYCITV